jgi:hypothetical protein
MHFDETCFAHNVIIIVFVYGIMEAGTLCWQLSIEERCFNSRLKVVKMDVLTIALI